MINILDPLQMNFVYQTIKINLLNLLHIVTLTCFLPKSHFSRFNLFEILNSLITKILFITVNIFHKFIIIYIHVFIKFYVLITSYLRNLITSIKLNENNSYQCCNKDVCSFIWKLIKVTLIFWISLLFCASLYCNLGNV